MDFKQFDNRTPAETGQRLVLLDPTVREGKPLMNGDKECAVIVRGSTSRSVQAAIRQQQKDRILKKSELGDVDQGRVMEDVHIDLCDGASPLIVGFENVVFDGKPLTTSKEDIQKFLDLTFPVMGTKQDAKGNNILNENGELQFEMKNNPFAAQINDFSAKQALSLGNGQKP